MEVSFFLVEKVLRSSINPKSGLVFIDILNPESISNLSTESVQAFVLYTL